MLLCIRRTYMLQFKLKGLLRVHYNGRKPIISYLYEDGSLYFATSRSSRKMKYFNTVGQDVELSLGFFGRQRCQLISKSCQMKKNFLIILRKQLVCPPLLILKNIK